MSSTCTPGSALESLLNARLQLLRIVRARILPMSASMSEEDEVAAVETDVNAARGCSSVRTNKPGAHEQQRATGRSG